MNKTLNIVLLSSLLLLVSCERWGSEERQDGRELIWLSARFDAPLSTKVPYDTEDGNPTPDNHLNVDVWASTVENVFLHKEGWDGTKDVDVDGDGTISEGERAVSVHTHAFFQSDKPQLLSQAVYPPVREENGNKVADNVYFVGLYPQSAEGSESWTANDEGTAATFEFDGSQDLMFAPEVVGHYDTSVDQTISSTNTPTLHFYHLLTRFNISVGPNLDGGVGLYDIQNAWGNIVGLKIQCWDVNGWSYGVKQLTLDLTETIGEESPVSDISQAIILGTQDRTENGMMNFYQTGKNEVFPSEDGYSFTTLEEVAYVMCAPVTATADDDEYVLIIETQKEGQDVKITELPVNLKVKSENGEDGDLEGTSMGREFDITLLFNKTRAIAEVVSVASWETGGQGSGDIFD